MLINNLILIAVLCSNLLWCQHDLKSPFYFPDISFINASRQGNININNDVGTFSQDIKKAVGIFDKSTVSSTNISHLCSCTLINNVTQNGTVYLLTAAHCINNAKIGGEVGLLFSSNYEYPHANERGTDDFSPLSVATRQVYIISGIIMINDTKSDIALIKIHDDSLNTIGEIYYSGWDFSLDKKNTAFINISHPKADHKKIFYDPDNLKLIYTLFTPKKKLHTRSGLFYESTGGWNGTGALLETGSSGSGLFDSNNALVAVYSAGDKTSQVASVISNQYYNLNGTPSLSTYLDPNQTWLNHIPGGYKKDLIPVDDPFELDLPAESSFSTETIYINNSLIFDDLKQIKLNDWEKILGIKINSPNSSQIALTMMYSELNTEDIESLVTEERLIFGSFANSTIPENPNRANFRLAAWNCNETQTHDKLKCNRFGEPAKGLWKWFATTEGSSTDVKESYIRAVNNEAFNNPNQIYSLKDNYIPVKIYLHNLGESTVNVQAVSYPGDVPRNALQLFKPQEVEKKFKSYKYKPSRGENSDNLYIDTIKVELEQHVLNSDNECVSLDKKTLQEVTTGNNGGYLNLVNPNFSIDNVVASDPKCPKNKLLVTINTSDYNSNKHYGAWLDYYKDRKEGGNPNPEDDYTYNFVDDVTPHPAELIGKDSNLGITKTLEHEIPYETELLFNAFNTIQTRLRVALAESPQSPNILTQDGIYTQGEVEDYLVRIRKNTNDDKCRVAKDKVSNTVDTKQPARMQQMPPRNQNNPGFRSSVGQNRQYRPTGSSKGTGYAVSFGLGIGDISTNAFNPFLFSTADIMSGAIELFTGSSGGDNPPFPAPLDNLGFDTNKPSAWSYWDEFDVLYSNLAEFIRFWNNQRLDPDVPFELDSNGIMPPEDRALFERLKNLYNTVASFKNTVNGVGNVYDLLHLVYTLDGAYDILSYAFGSQVTVFKSILRHVLNYQYYVEDFLDCLKVGECEIDITNSISKIAIDWWGSYIPNTFYTRTLANTFSITSYPLVGKIAIIYKAKGDNNVTTIGINHNGNLVYEMKLGSETKTITSNTILPLDEALGVTTQFNNGILSAFINNTPVEQTAQFTASTAMTYNNFTDDGNGARWGAPIGNTTQSISGKEVPLNGKFYQFMIFDEVLDENYIDLLGYCKIPKSSNATQKSVATTKDLALEKEKATDFSIFPNPAKDKINILVEVEHAGVLSVEIFDLNGRKVYEIKKPQIGKGHQIITLNNLKLSAGNYVVKVRAGNVKRNEQVVLE